MGTILAISSQVARGHVGLSAIVPALQALGHEVIAMPTVMLSNHPGHGKVAGQRIGPRLLSEMLETLDGHGWLASVDAVLSGYLPSPGHVEFVAEAVARVRSRHPAALYFCDPVLGDDPEGLYIAEDAARALAAELVPRADFAFPNRFELTWLSGQPVVDSPSARAAARTIKATCTVATSIPQPDGTLATLVIASDQAWQASVVRQDGVPNGTGDLLSALMIGYIVGGRTIQAALGAAVGALEGAIGASVGQDELQLANAFGSFSSYQPRPVAALP
jgi:pyridoxine kinase